MPMQLDLKRYLLGVGVFGWCLCLGCTGIWGRVRRSVPEVFLRRFCHILYLVADAMDLDLYVLLRLWGCREV